MYAYYTWAQGLWRSSTLDPLLSITWSAERSSLLAGEVVWQLLTRTAPLVALGVLLGFLLPHAWALTLPLALGLPALLALDSARYLCFSRQHAWKAAAIDWTWTGSFFAVAAVFWVAARTSVAFPALWLLGVAAAAPLWLPVLGKSIKPGPFREPRVRSLRATTTVEFLAGSGLLSLLYAAASLLLPASTAAGIRVALTIWMPASIFFMSLVNVAIPRFADADGDAERR